MTDIFFRIEIKWLDSQNGCWKHHSESFDTLEEAFDYEKKIPSIMKQFKNVFDFQYKIVRYSFDVIKEEKII